MTPERMTYLEEQPGDITPAEVLQLIRELRERDARLVAALDGQGRAREAALILRAGLERAADIAAGRAPREVHDPSIPPGGYVCAWPLVPGDLGVHGPDGVWICGYPTESQPCPEHGSKHDEDL